MSGFVRAGFLLLASLGPCGGGLPQGELDGSSDGASDGSSDAPSSDGEATLEAGALDVTPADAGPDAAPYVRPEPPARFAAGLMQLQRSLQAGFVPGAAVAILEGGRLAYAAGYGVRRANRTAPVTEHTLFRVGSITKMVTASAALSLVDEGRLDLAQPVTRYEPALRLRAPADPSQITMQHLLTHTSGLPDDLTLECAVGPTALAQLLRDRADTPLWAPPGRVFNYSNLGYALAARVIEAVDGRPFDTVVTSRVLERGGMSDATFDTAVARTRDYSTGHVVSETGGVGLTFEPNAYDCAGGHAAGYLFASVVDYAHLIETLLAGGRTMLRESSARALTGDQAATRNTPAEHYGYGFFRYPLRGETALEHGGFVLGWETSIYVLPERGTAVVLFINANPANFTVSSAARALLVSVAGLTGPSESYSTSSSTWGPYVGTYNDPLNLGRVVVTLTGGSLRATVSLVGGATPLQGSLTQIAGDHFYFRGGSLATQNFGVTFWRDAEAPAAYFVSRSGVAARVE